MKQIGFIGVGIMGKSMVRNLMKAGYELHIYARTKAKVEDVISEGAGSLSYRYDDDEPHACGKTL